MYVEMEKNMKYLEARVEALEREVSRLKEENANLLNDLIYEKTNERND